jgi:hypothetical protein
MLFFVTHNAGDPAEVVRQVVFIVVYARLLGMLLP